ncbi:hypothetical protein ES705_34416 [subsurface metagenome]
MDVILFAELTAAVERELPSATRQAYSRDITEHRQLMPWAKLVTATDPSKRGGYGFLGPWVKRGYTDTKTLTLPAVALVALEHTRPQTRLTYRTYHVAVIHSTGLISIVENITTDSLTPGWAHRIMPAIANLLQDLDNYNTTHRPSNNGPWGANRIRLTPLPPTAGWYP